MQTATELAKAFGVSKTSAKNWRDDPNFPGGERGPWHEPDVRNYLAAKGSPAVGGGVGGDLLHDEDDRKLAKAERLEKVLLLRAKREREELRRDKEKGNLVHRDEAEVEVAGKFALLRDSLQTIPDRLMAVIPEQLRAQVRPDMQNVMNDIFRQLARLGELEAE